MWARGRCTISPHRFLAECHKRRLNQGSFVLLCFALFAFFRLCIVCVLSVLICLLSCVFHQQLHEVVSAGFRVGFCCLQHIQFHVALSDCIDLSCDMVCCSQAEVTLESCRLIPLVSTTHHACCGTQLTVFLTLSIGEMF